MAEVQTQFLLTGVYAPIYAGAALQYFLQNGNFGVIPAPNNTNQLVPLMNTLPLARQGYLLRNTLTTLFYLYLHMNGLDTENNKIRSDNFMLDVFGRMPANFYQYRDPNGQITKISMDQAINQGLVTAPMSSYQVLAQLYPPGYRINNKRDDSFRQESFSSHYIQNIINMNYWTIPGLMGNPAYSQIVANLNDSNIQEQLKQEHNIVKSILQQIHDSLDQDKRRLRQKELQDAMEEANVESILEADVPNQITIDLADSLERKLVGGGYVINSSFLNELKKYMNTTGKGVAISIPDRLNHYNNNIVINADALMAIFAKYQVVY